MAAGALPAPALQPRRYELPVSARPPLFTAASHANNMPVSAKLNYGTSLKFNNSLLKIYSVGSVHVVCGFSPTLSLL